MLHRRWQGSSPENNETDPVEDTKDQDGLVLSEILISNDGTENRRDYGRSVNMLVNRSNDMLTIAEPLEEQVQAGGGLVAHSQSLWTIGSSCAVVDVVLEETLRSFDRSVRCPGSASSKA